MKSKSIYYWASWKRVFMLTVPLGGMLLLPTYVGGVLRTDTVFVLLGVLWAIAIFSLILGTTFFRIKDDHIHYTTSLFEWHRMYASEIERIVIIPRFFFTDKVTAVQIERENPGFFPGMLISRDAFPDETIATLVSHLKHLNPSIELDEGVQKILQERNTKMSLSNLDQHERKKQWSSKNEKHQGNVISNT